MKLKIKDLNGSSCQPILPHFQILSVIVENHFHGPHYVREIENQSHLLEISEHASPASTTYSHCSHNQHIIIASTKGGLS